jgi:hypothetical protein
MDFLSNIIGFTAIAASDEAIAANNNEIKIHNFMNQARNTTILQYIPNCKIEQAGLFGNSTYIVQETDLLNAYQQLYDYLVKKEVILKKNNWSFVWTLDSVYTINKNKIDVVNLQNVLKTTNADFPKLLKCYTIQIVELSNFLENYKSKILEDVQLVAAAATNKKGGKRRTPPQKNAKNALYVMFDEPELIPLFFSFTFTFDNPFLLKWFVHSNSL